MARYERFGTRSLAYSGAHREWNDEFMSSDLDMWEYCRYCIDPLLLTETVWDRGQDLSLKWTGPLEHLAALAHLPAFLVAYGADEKEGPIRGINAFVLPTRRLVAETIDDWIDVLLDLRRRHRCYVGHADRLQRLTTRYSFGTRRFHPTDEAQPALLLGL